VADNDDSMMSEGMLRAASSLAEHARAVAATSVPSELGFGQRWVTRRELDADGEEMVHAGIAPVATSPIDFVIARVRVAVQDSTASRQFEQSLQNDPVIRGMLGKMLFSAGIGVPITPDLLMSEFLARIVSKGHENSAESALNETLELIRVPRYAAYMVAQLDGLRGPRDPIELEPGLEIARLTDADIERGMMVGAIEVPFRSHMPMWIASHWGIRVTFDEVGVVANQDAVDEPFREFSARRTDAVRRIGEVLDALRLFKEDGSVRSPIAYSYGEEIFSVAWVGIGVQPLQVPGGGGQPGAQYELPDDNASAFVAFYKQLLDARRRAPGLDAAIRRFGYAAERGRADDKVTDLAIAAESLLLDDSEKSEKSFQVSLRMAHSVTLQDAARLAVFRFMRRAYGVRSAIVHGGTPRKRDLVGLQGEEVTLDRFALDLETIMRALLREVIEHEARGHRWESDWETRVFEARE
jgi:hypothetical protein